MELTAHPTAEWAASAPTTPPRRTAAAPRADEAAGAGRAGTRAMLGVAFFVLFVAVWAAATLGGYVPRPSSPTR